MSDTESGRPRRALEPMDDDELLDDELLHLGIRCKVLGKAPAQRRAKVAGTIYRIRVKAHFAERIGKAVKNARPGMDQCSINIK